MALVTKTRTYITGENLPAVDYNADRDEMIAGINSIDNVQISATAGILETKITFSGASGHRHSGGTSGKTILATGLDTTGITAGQVLQVNSTGTGIQGYPAQVTATRAYTFFLPNAFTTGTQGPKIYVRDDCTIVSIHVAVSTAPTSASCDYEIVDGSGTQLFTDSLSIGDTTQNTAGLIVGILEGSYVQLNITQTGGAENITASVVVSIT
jgi:hypothetical protein